MTIESRRDAANSDSVRANYYYYYSVLLLFSVL